MSGAALFGFCSDANPSNRFYAGAALLGWPEANAKNAGFAGRVWVILDARAAGAPAQYAWLSAIVPACYGATAD